MTDFKLVSVGKRDVSKLAYAAKCLNTSIEEALAIIINSAYEKIRYTLDSAVAEPTQVRRIRVMCTWHDEGFYTYRGVVFKDGYAPESVTVNTEDVNPKSIELADDIEYTNYQEAYFHICEMLYYN